MQRIQCNQDHGNRRSNSLEKARESSIFERGRGSPLSEATDANLDFL